MIDDNADASEALMDDATTCNIDTACRRLMMRYAAAMDLQDWGLFLSVFADDFVWTRPGMRPMRTKDEVRAFFDHMWRERRAKNPGYVDVHLITTCSIEIENGMKAKGYSWGIMYTAQDADIGVPAVMPTCPQMVVLYRDTFERGAEGWRITEHSAEHVFLAPTYTQPPIIPNLSLSQDA